MDEIRWEGNVLSAGGVSAELDGVRVELMQFKPDGIGPMEKRQFPLMRKLFSEMWIVYIAETEPFRILQPQPREFILRGNANQVRREAEELVAWYFAYRASCARSEG